MLFLFSVEISSFFSFWNIIIIFFILLDIFLHLEIFCFLESYYFWFSGIYFVHLLDIISSIFNSNQTHDPSCWKILHFIFTSDEINNLVTSWKSSSFSSILFSMELSFESRIFLLHFLTLIILGICELFSCFSSFYFVHLLYH